MNFLLNPKEWIKENQEAVIEYYLGTKISSKLIKSPFRVDNHPTCGFYYGKTGRLYLHDFATDEHMDAIEIVKKKFNLSYTKALAKINEDINNFEESNKADINEDKFLEFIPGTNNYSYFNKLGIKDATLKRYGVYTARAIYLNEELTWRSTEKNPIFVYQYPSGRFKGYRPLSKDKDKKWISNCSLKDIQGYHQLNPTGSILFITSSLKDVMVLHEMGFPAMAFNSETIPVRGENSKFVKEILEQMKERFSKIYFFLDNDSTGVTHSTKLKDAYGIDNILIPTGLPKDISDYVTKYGMRKAKKLVKKLISKRTSYEQKDFLELADSLSLPDDPNSMVVARDLLDLPGIEITL